MEQHKNKNAAKDLVFGFLLTLFGIYVIVESLGMKYFKSFIDGAGFFPCIIGAVLTVLGAILTFIGFKAGGCAQLKEVCNGKFIVSFIKDDGTVRVLILLAMMVVYMYFLIGWIGFLFATPIYLFANFMFLNACKSKGPIPGWVISLIISILTPIIVYYSFKLGLGVTLP